MSQMWLLCVWGISWTKSAYCYSDTFSSHHPCCRYTNHLCTTHVINLVDPGAARFLASQMKLLRRYSHKLPHIWKSSKCNNLFSSSNSSQLKFPAKSQIEPTIWYMVPRFQEHFLFYSSPFQEKGFMRDRWKKYVFFIPRNSVYSSGF